MMSHPAMNGTATTTASTSALPRRSPWPARPAAAYPMSTRTSPAIASRTPGVGRIAVLDSLKAAEVFDFDAGYRLRQLDAEDRGKEVQFGVESAGDVLGLSEAVALTFEGNVGEGDSLFPKYVHNELCLRGRYYLVVEPLEDDRGRRQAIGVRDRGTLDVDRLTLGIGGDQLVEVARFKLVGVLGEWDQVGKAEMTRSEGEKVAGRECLERRVSAGAAAGDDDLVGVSQAAIDQVARRVDRVLHVKDSPGAVQAVAVFPAVPGASTVIHVDEGEAA